MAINSQITLLQILLIILLIHSATSQTLASAEITHSSSYLYIYNNFIGLAMNLPEVIPYLNNTLFQDYLLNSIIQGYWSSAFRQTIHTPLGYKYICNSTYYIGAINCSVELNNL